MAALPKIRFTVQEYLALDRASERKFEFMDGEIVAMAGASREHNIINYNLSRLIGNHILNRPCEAYAADMRVHTAKTQEYAYPDQVIVCGEPKFVPAAKPATLLNPTVIFEVLSPTTSEYDRSMKFDAYRQIPSLQDYVMVDQDTCWIIHYTRQAPTKWSLVETEDMTDTIELASIGCTLLVAEIYAKVNWDK